MTKQYDIVDIIDNKSFTYQLYADLGTQSTGIGSTTVEVTATAPLTGFTLQFTLTGIPTANTGNCAITLTGASNTYEVAFPTYLTGNPRQCTYSAPAVGGTNITVNNYSAGAYSLLVEDTGHTELTGGATGSGEFVYFGIPTGYVLSGTESELITGVSIITN